MQYLLLPAVREAYGFVEAIFEDSDKNEEDESSLDEEEKSKELK